MASMIKDFLGYLKLGDEEEFDDYDELEEENEKRHSERAERPEKTERHSTTKSFQSLSSKSEDREAAADTKRERNNYRMERTASNKIVPIRTTSKGLEVCIMKPSSFEDAQEICDMLLTGRASVVNLEGFDPLDAQRIMDFISGCIYAINGKLHQISKYIFIFSPESIDISGDYLEFMPDDGFEVPTLNKEF
ncbi:FtsZ-interacting protein related to cell division [Lachnospiraceae bacterium KM106-2]|nr:FtsZ-interacting protein related to cell division [Lachnospiraceae bacterium KM106-2]